MDANTSALELRHATPGTLARTRKRMTTNNSTQPTLTPNSDSGDNAADHTRSAPPTRPRKHANAITATAIPSKNDGQPAHMASPHAARVSVKGTLRVRRSNTVASIDSAASAMSIPTLASLPL